MEIEPVDAFENCEKKSKHPNQVRNTHCEEVKDCLDEDLTM